MGHEVKWARDGWRVVRAAPAVVDMMGNPILNSRGEPLNPPATIEVSEFIPDEEQPMPSEPTRQPCNWHREYKSTCQKCVLINEQAQADAAKEAAGRDARRLRLYRINNEVLIGLLRMDGKKSIRIEGMPADARIVGVSDQIHFAYDQTTFKVWSSEFDAVEDGQAIPEGTLSVSQVLWEDEVRFARDRMQHMLDLVARRTT